MDRAYIKVGDRKGKWVCPFSPPPCNPPGFCRQREVPSDTEAIWMGPKSKTITRTQELILPDIAQVN